MQCHLEQPPAPSWASVSPCTLKSSGFQALLPGASDVTKQLPAVCSRFSRESSDGRVSGALGGGTSPTQDKGVAALSWGGKNAGLRRASGVLTLVLLRGQDLGASLSGRSGWYLPEEPELPGPWSPLPLGATRWGPWWSSCRPVCFQLQGPFLSGPWLGQSAFVFPEVDGFGFAREWGQSGPRVLAVTY